MVSSDSPVPEDYSPYDYDDISSAEDTGVYSSGWLMLWLDRFRLRNAIMREVDDHRTDALQEMEDFEELLRRGLISREAFEEFGNRIQEDAKSDCPTPMDHRGAFDDSEDDDVNWE